MEKHSMRHLLWAALLLLYCSCGCLAAVVQQLPQKGESALQAYTVSAVALAATPDKKEGDWQPIRIGVYTKFVEDMVKFCTTRNPEVLNEYVTAGEEFEQSLEDEEDESEELDHLEQLKQRCQSDEKMTEEKKKVLFTEVLPKAIKLHTDRLKVEMKRSSTSETEINILIGCELFKVPLEGKVHETLGVDFMIYVGLSTEYKKIKICTKDKENRPTSAVIKFVPEEIKATRQYIRLTAHEIAHALGFHHDLMQTLGMIETLDIDPSPKQKQMDGRKFHKVVSPQTLAKLNEHYGCEKGNELKGLYLENQGIEKNSSHWERYIAKDELMSTYIGEPSGMYYTALTLAVFHAMPFYSADFDNAETMSWGNQSICELLEGKKKVPTKTDYPNMFCEEDAENVILQCTSDRFALGICSKTERNKLPEGYEYVKDENTNSEANDLMNGYKFIRSLEGTGCEDGKEDLLPGSVLGQDSRCLNLENPLEFKKGDNGNGVMFQGICAKVKCNNKTRNVSVQLKGYEDEEKNWRQCSDESATIKLEDSEFIGGTIRCPKYEEVCTGLLGAELPTNIRFFSGKSITHVYDVDVNGKKEEKQEKKQIDAPNKVVSTSSLGNEEQKSHVKPTARPVKQQHQETEQEDQKVQQRVESQIPSSEILRSENDNGSNQQKVTGPLRGSDSIVGGLAVQSVQNSPSPSVSPAAAPAHATASSKAPAHGISQQIADPPAENNDKQNEDHTTSKVQDHQQASNQTQNEVQSPTEANAQTDDSTDVQNNTHGEESASSTSNPNSDDNTVQSTNTVNGADDRSSGTVNSDALNGTKLTEDKMRETLNHTNVMGVMGTDSSIMFTSYMAPLALLVCVVGFVMVP
ncbi:surface protease GP63 [Trypanosoma theileri]|uniref:Leishmanolysin-like peptidase n=1 Tax=Trypanosoma theileri TaxID=67003 RepID=A0A1X0NJU4_9TRYP|nr:surface protease GP63 [Trypanosoma theileri]ORC84927.1 surface protease GP63 [Trypanosoma theileri]